jgi:hypothetical protein
MSSNFKVEKDAETGKFKVYNKKKKSYSSRMFASKESAAKMCSVYDNLGKRKAKPLLTEEEKQVLKKKAEMPKAKPATKKTQRKKPDIDPKLLNPSD